MNELSTKEISELLLAAMYEEAERLGHINFFFSINEIASNVGLEDIAAVAEACRSLEENGRILLSLGPAESMSAFITPLGEELVNEGGETGIINEYRRFKSASEKTEDIAASDNMPSLESHITFEPAMGPQSEKTAQSQDISHIIASMELLVGNDSLIQDSVKEDLVIDLKTLELQLSKKVINRPLVDLLFADLKEVTALSPLLDLLISIRSV